MPLLNPGDPFPRLTITTAGGPTDEFCPPEAGWRIRARSRSYPGISTQAFSNRRFRSAGPRSGRPHPNMGQSPARRKREARNHAHAAGPIPDPAINIEG